MMPVTVRKRRKGETGKLWKIVSVETGAVEGESDTKADAEMSASIKNQAVRKKRGG